MNIDHWRNPELAASETPKAQEGTWTLTAPDGRIFTAQSPIQCCAAESNQRIPPAVALARIARGLDEDEQEKSELAAPQPETAKVQAVVDAWNNLDPQHLIAIEYSSLGDAIAALYASPVLPEAPKEREL
jgi:hypothetical protein